MDWAGESALIQSPVKLEYERIHNMPLAARLTDMHVCPMVTGVVPHVGGPIVGPGAPTVLVWVKCQRPWWVTCASVWGRPTLLPWAPAQ
jgi:hypothetical protein